MTDTFVALSWCVYVSIFFVVLLYYNSDGVNGLFFTEMGKMNN